MLIKCSKEKTNYAIPIFINGRTMYRYYDNEYLLFKAYNQLKKINTKFKVFYPIILTD